MVKFLVVSTVVSMLVLAGIGPATAGPVDSRKCHHERDGCIYYSTFVTGKIGSNGNPRVMAINEDKEGGVERTCEWVQAFMAYERAIDGEIEIVYAEKDAFISTADGPPAPEALGTLLNGAVRSHSKGNQYSNPWRDLECNGEPCWGHHGDTCR